MAQYLLSVFGPDEMSEFVESKEYIGGFWIIEAADLDQALALAVEGSKACQGKVEVRPFQ